MFAVEGIVDFLAKTGANFRLVAIADGFNTLYPAYDNSYAGWGDDPNADRAAQAARYQRQRLANYIYNLSGGQLWP